MTASAVANVKGGLFGDVAGLLTLTQISGRASQRMNIAKELGKQATDPVRAVLTTLLGAAAGSTATKTWPQIDASTSELGGKRIVNTINLVNRATTSADVTEITADLLTLSTRTTFGKTPPANKDGSPLGEQR